MDIQHLTLIASGEITGKINTDSIVRAKKKKKTHNTSFDVIRIPSILYLLFF